MNVYLCFVCSTELKEAMPSGSPDHCERVIVIARARMVAETSPAMDYKRKNRDLPPTAQKKLVFDYFENELWMKVSYEPMLFVCFQGVIFVL